MLAIGLAFSGIIAAAGTVAGSAPLAIGGSSEPPGTEVDLAGIDREATVRIAFAGPINTLDPHKPTNSTYPTWIYPIYDRLFEVDADDNVQPMLAESSEFSADGATLTLHLRDDVVFHDGTPVNAAAVKASLERAKTVEASTVANVLAGVTAIEAVDDQTVALTLDGVGAEIVAVLASNAGAIINPAVLDDPSVNLDTAPPIGAGSGPYVATSSEPNVETGYERAPEYWDDSAGLMQGFTLTRVAQTSTRLAGLLAGDFDLIMVTADGIEEAEAGLAAGQFSMYVAPGAGQDIMFNIAGGDLADVEVRQAVALALDREEIQVIYPCVVTTQPQREGHWAYNPDIVNVYDPDQARELIDARGGASFELTFAAGSSTEPLATVIQAQLAEVGITVTLRGIDQAQVFTSLSDGSAQAIISTMQPGPDPAEVLNRYFLGGTSIARGTAADELAAIAAPGADPSLSQDERAAIYHDAFQYIADQYLFVPVCQSEQGWASTSEFVGIDQMPNYNRGVPDLSSIGVVGS